MFRCGECGAGAPKWAGRCPTCDEWNTLVEEVERPAAVGSPGAAAERAVPIVEVDAHEWAARPTGVSELDRVLGGGLVPGSVTLLGGEPGIGKSTLLLQALASLAGSGARCLLVSAEESRQQVRLRAERLGALPASLWLVGETVLPNVVADIEQVAPDVCVIDSIQTLHDPELGSAPGSVTQVRECAQRLVQVSKARGLATLLVGHVTKDGALAGPRVLEHIVDTVLSFEGERHHALRLLRALKHRFGPTSELGLFEMVDAGLVGVPDAGRDVPRRPPRRSARVGGGAHDRGPPPPAGRAPGARGAGGGRGHAASVGAGARQRPAGPAAGGARPSGAAFPRRGRRLRVRGRRGASSSPVPTWRSRWRWPPPTPTPLCPTTSWRAARWASAASCAR